MSTQDTEDRPDVIERLSWIHISDNRVLFVRSPEGDVFFDPGVKRDHQRPDEVVLADKMLLDLDINLVPGTIRRLTSFSFAAPAYGKEDGITVEICCYESDYLGLIKPTKFIKDIAWIPGEKILPVSVAGFAIVQRLANDGVIPGYALECIAINDE